MYRCRRDRVECSTRGGSRGLERRHHPAPYIPIGFAVYYRSSAYFQKEQGHIYVDIWDSTHVRFPCSPRNTFRKEPANDEQPLSKWYDFFFEFEISLPTSLSSELPQGSYCRSTFASHSFRDRSAGSYIQIQSVVSQFLEFRWIAVLLIEGI